MSQIQSGQKHQAVTFEGPREPRGSMSIMLTDFSPDASWNLRIDVETVDGGWFVLGAVDTIPVQAAAVIIPNRVIAICSVPGAIDWKVTASLNAGTPQKNRSAVFAEMKLGSSPEYAAGCCPLVPIPGNATETGSGGGPSQSPNGPPQAAPTLRFFTGTGRALGVDVVYLGRAGSGFVQQHDFDTTGAPSDASMVGIGFPIGTPTTLQFRWSPAEQGRKFSKGFAFALSSTQITYTAPAPGETIAGFAQWLPE